MKELDKSTNGLQFTYGLKLVSFDIIRYVDGNRLLLLDCMSFLWKQTIVHTISSDYSLALVRTLAFLPARSQDTLESYRDEKFLKKFNCIYFMLYFLWFKYGIEYESASAWIDKCYIHYVKKEDMTMGIIKGELNSVLQYNNADMYQLHLQKEDIRPWDIVIFYNFAYQSNDIYYCKDIHFALCIWEDLFISKYGFSSLYCSSIAQIELTYRTSYIGRYVQWPQKNYEKNIIKLWIKTWE